jgi:hypothetical protein
MTRRRESSLKEFLELRLSFWEMLRGSTSRSCSYFIFLAMEIWK